MFTLQWLFREVGFFNIRFRRSSNAKPDHTMNCVCFFLAFPCFLTARTAVNFTIAELLVHGRFVVFYLLTDAQGPLPLSFASAYKTRMRFYERKCDSMQVLFLARGHAAKPDSQGTEEVSFCCSLLWNGDAQHSRLGLGRSRSRNVFA